MAKKEIIYLIFIILAGMGCSPELAEIQGKSVSHREFIGHLIQYDPQYFNKSRAFVENKLQEWKRLNIALENYLNDEAVYIDLQKAGFDKSINPNQVSLYRLMTLGEYTLMNTGKRVTIESLKKSETRIKYNPLPIPRPSVTSPPSKLSILAVEGHFKLSYIDLKGIFPGKNDKGLSDLLNGSIVPRMHFAMDGMRRGFHLNNLFKRYWTMKWRNHLVLIYQRKKKKEMVARILADETGRLRNHYEQNKDQYVVYKSTTSNKSTDKEKYQFSFGRMRENIAMDLSEVDIKKWKESLRKKYHISVNERYFQQLGERDIKKLQNK